MGYSTEVNTVIKQVSKRPPFTRRKIRSKIQKGRRKENVPYVTTTITIEANENGKTQNAQFVGKMDI